MQIRTLGIGLLWEVSQAVEVAIYIRHRLRAAETMDYELILCCYLRLCKRQNYGLVNKAPHVAVPGAGP